MPDRKILETFPNPAPRRDYVIEHTHHEFTSLCPMTGHPDFAHITVRYVADKACVELKSLKLYFHAFRTSSSTPTARTMPAPRRGKWSLVLRFRPVEFDVYAQAPQRCGGQSFSQRPGARVCASGFERRIKLCKENPVCEIVCQRPLRWWKS